MPLRDLPPELRELVYRKPRPQQLGPPSAVVNLMVSPLGHVGSLPPETGSRELNRKTLVL